MIRHRKGPDHGAAFGRISPGPVALSAMAEGYEVFVVTDASGTFNEVTRDYRNLMTSYGALKAPK